MKTAKFITQTMEEMFKERLILVLFINLISPVKEALLWNCQNTITLWVHRFGLKVVETTAYDLSVSADSTLL